ncbi:MAG: hypothetical protein GEV03_05525 [Streptosporangiales bacterium]|nr:hypothetical protein [Streptosporangiales bacterium]
MSGQLGEPVGEVAAYRPDWVVWWGKLTGSYWAMPNWPGAPREMVEAPDVAILDERMTEVEDRYPRRSEVTWRGQMQAPAEIRVRR